MGWGWGQGGLELGLGTLTLGCLLLSPGDSWKRVGGGVWHSGASGGWRDGFGHPSWKEVVKARECAWVTLGGGGVEEITPHTWRSHQEAGEGPERGCPRSQQGMGMLPVLTLLVGHINPRLPLGCGVQPQAVVGDFERAVGIKSSWSRLQRDRDWRDCRQCQRRVRALWAKPE